MEEAGEQAAVTVPMRVGMPERAVAEGLDRMGPVTAAVWSKHDKQGKEKKANKRRRERRKRIRKLQKQKRRREKGKVENAR